MAKIVKGKSVKRSKADDIFPFERENFIILGIGIIVILVGYFALSGSSVEGTMPLVVSPLLLVLGYCVIIPIGILYRKREKEQAHAEAPSSVPQQ